MSQAGIVDIESSNPQIPTSFVTDNGVAVPLANVLEILGTTVAAHGVPLETTGSGNTVTVVTQYASATAGTTTTAAGVASFNSADFIVDANGWVSFTGGSVTQSIAVDASTPPGTNPVVPNGSGIITVTGGQVAAGTTTNVIRTDSLAANTYTIQIQRSQAVGVSTIGDNGVSHFNSTFFTVDANGFVSLNGASVGETITGNTGGALSPTAGNWNIFGASTAAGTSPVVTSGSVSTLTVNVQKSQAIAASDATKVGLSNFNSAHFSVDANGFVDLIGGGIAIDSIGTQTGTNPIVPTAAGLVTINGAVVAAGTNPVRSDGTGANTMAIEVQISQALAATDATKIGLSNFNSAQFTVDANGFVSTLGTGPMLTLTPDLDFDGTAATPVSPQAGNINVLSYNPAVANVTNTYNSTGAATGNLQVEHKAWLTALVVDPSTTIGSRGTFSTIAAALTAASSGQDIFIRTGTYTENLTLKAGVNLVGFSGDETTPNVTIIGTCTMTTAGAVTISNVRLQTNSAALLAVTGSANSVVTLNNCYLNCTNNTGISLTSSGTGCAIYLWGCSGNIGTTGISLFANSSAGSITINYSRFSNGGASTTASTISGSGSGCFLYYSYFQNVISTSGTTGSFTITNCIFDTGSINTTAIAHNSTNAVASTINKSFMATGSASAITIGAGASAVVKECDISSSNTNVITGSGTLTFGDILFSGTSSVMNPTTQAAYYTNLGKYKATLQPAFTAYNTTAPQNVTGDGTAYVVVFDTEIADQANNFDGTSTFTAPVTGFYHFDAQVLCQNAIATMSNQIRLNISSAPGGGIGVDNAASFVGNNSLQISLNIPLTAGATVAVQVTFSGGTKVVDIYGGANDCRTVFSGYQLA